MRDGRDVMLYKNLARAEALISQLTKDPGDRFYHTATKNWWKYESGGLVIATPPKEVEAMQKEIRQQDAEIIKLRQENQGLRSILQEMNDTIYGTYHGREQTRDLRQDQ